LLVKDITIKKVNPLILWYQNTKKGLATINKTVAIYTFFDDILKSVNCREPEHRKTSNAEIITVALLAAGYFGGNDAAYTDYLPEEMLADNGIRLPAHRKSNSKRPHHPCTEYLISIQRKRMETAFSDIAK
jgi:hypothetical protein